MKKILVTFVTVAMASALLVGCSSESNSSDNKENVKDTTKVQVSQDTQTDNKEADNKETGSESGETLTLDEIYEKVTTEVEFPTLLLMEDEDYLLNYYGIKAENVEEKTFYVAEDYLKADAYVVLKASGSDAMAELEDNLKTYVTNKKNELIDYNPDEYKVVENAKLGTVGSYTYMIITANADEAEAALLEYLK